MFYNATKQRFGVESGCISLHVNQARANLGALGQHANNASYHGQPLAPADPNGVGLPLAGGAGGVTGGVAAAIAGISESLHEELRTFLRTFSARLEAKEAALTAACDRVTANSDQNLNDLARRLDARLSDQAHRMSLDHTAAMDTLRASLTDVRDQVVASQMRIENLAAGDDWARQLQEATTASDRKTALRLEAMERQLAEAKGVEAARHKAFQDGISKRCEALEQRTSKRFGDSDAVVEQVTRMLPDIERVQELCSRVQADRAAAETWQRRLAACEGTPQRMAALEARMDGAERQTERVLNEHTQALREGQHAAGLVASRVSTLEGAVKGVEQQWKAAEQRLCSTLEQRQRQGQQAMEVLREHLQQRFSEMEVRQRQELERACQRTEQRCHDLTQRVQLEVRNLTLRSNETRAGGEPQGSRSPEPRGKRWGWEQGPGEAGPQPGGFGRVSMDRDRDRYGDGGLWRSPRREGGGAGTDVAGSANFFSAARGVSELRPSDRADTSTWGGSGQWPGAAPGGARQSERAFVPAARGGREAEEAFHAAGDGVREANDRFLRGGFEFRPSDQADSSTWGGSGQRLGRAASGVRHPEEPFIPAARGGKEAEEAFRPAASGVRDANDRFLRGGADAAGSAQLYGARLRTSDGSNMSTWGGSGQWLSGAAGGAAGAKHAEVPSIPAADGVMEANDRFLQGGAQPEHRRDGSNYGPSVRSTSREGPSEPDGQPFVLNGGGARGTQAAKPSAEAQVQAHTLRQFHAQAQSQAEAKHSVNKQPNTRGVSPPLSRQLQQSLEEAAKPGDQEGSLPAEATKDPDLDHSKRDAHLGSTAGFGAGFRAVIEQPLGAGGEPSFEAKGGSASQRLGMEDRSGGMLGFGAGSRKEPDMPQDKISVPSQGPSEQEDLPELPQPMLQVSGGSGGASWLQADPSDDEDEEPLRQEPPAFAYGLPPADSPKSHGQSSLGKKSESPKYSPQTKSPEAGGAADARPCEKPRTWFDDDVGAEPALGPAPAAPPVLEQKAAAAAPAEQPQEPPRGSPSVAPAAAPRPATPPAAAAPPAPVPAAAAAPAAAGAAGRDARLSGLLGSRGRGPQPLDMDDEDEDDDVEAAVARAAVGLKRGPGAAGQKAPPASGPEVATSALLTQASERLASLQRSEFADEDEEEEEEEVRRPAKAAVEQTAGTRGPSKPLAGLAGASALAAKGRSPSKSLGSSGPLSLGGSGPLGGLLGLRGSKGPARMARRSFEDGDDDEDDDIEAMFAKTMKKPAPAPASQEVQEPPAASSFEDDSFHKSGQGESPAEASPGELPPSGDQTLQPLEEPVAARDLQNGASAGRASRDSRLDSLLGNGADFEDEESEMDEADIDALLARAL